MFDLLTLRCKYSENGCEETLKISDIYLMIMKRVAGFQREEKEGELQYSKRGRLKEMYENLSDFCESNNEEVEDVLFSMLTTTLFDKGKAKLAKKINSLWTEQTENVNFN